jgi:hypothetical protein
MHKTRGGLQVLYFCFLHTTLLYFHSTLILKSRTRNDFRAYSDGTLCMWKRKAFISDSPCKATAEDVPSDPRWEKLARLQACNIIVKGLDYRHVLQWRCRTLVWVHKVNYAFNIITLYILTCFPMLVISSSTHQVTVMLR